MAGRASRRGREVSGGGAALQLPRLEVVVLGRRVAGLHRPGRRRRRAPAARRRLGRARHGPGQRRQVCGAEVVCVLGDVVVVQATQWTGARHAAVDAVVTRRCLQLLCTTSTQQQRHAAIVHTTQGLVILGTDN